MSLRKFLGIKSKREKTTEKLEAFGWRKPQLKWNPPSILRFSLIALDDDGNIVKDWYLGTRSYRESEGKFFLVGYGLLDSSERTISCDEAIQILSKWLQRPASVFPWFPLEDFKDWFKWAKEDVPIEPVAQEQITELPECTFLVSATRGIT